MFFFVCVSVCNEIKMPIIQEEINRLNILEDKNHYIFYNFALEDEGDKKTEDLEYLLMDY